MPRRKPESKPPDRPKKEASPPVIPTATSPRVTTSRMVEVPKEICERLGPVVLRVFSSEDFHRVDMRSIAREAGMSFATIYRYYHDKEALLFRFIDHWLQSLYPAALEPLYSDEPVPVRLKKSLLYTGEFYERNPLVGRVIFMTVPLERWMKEHSFQQPDVAQLAIRTIRSGQRRGELRNDLEAGDIFDLYYGVFNRAFLMWDYRGRSYSLTESLDRLFDIACEGIVAPQQRAIPTPTVPSSASPDRLRASRARRS